MRPTVNKNDDGSLNTNSKRSLAEQKAAGANPNVLYRPTIYSYRCRGGLHMQSGSVDEDESRKISNSGSSTTGGSNISGIGKDSGGGQQPSDINNSLPLCRGIATKLEYAMSLPTARSHEEAVQLFEGAVMPVTTYAGDEDGSGGGGRQEQNHQHHSHQPHGQGHGKQLGGRNSNNSEKLTHSVSCYGATDVNVLMVQEIETEPIRGGGTGGDNVDESKAEQKDGAVSDGGGVPFDPLGALFGVPPPGMRRGNSGGSSGHDPSSPQDLQGRGGFFGPFGGFANPNTSGGGNGNGSTMQSISTSTRIVNGKFITTKEITTRDKNGQRHTKTETIVKNPDGTVEKTVSGDDANGQQQQRQQQQEQKNERDRGTNKSSSDNVDPFTEIDQMMGSMMGHMQQQQQQQQQPGMFPPPLFGFGGIDGGAAFPSPFGPPHRIVRQSEPQVVAVVPECKLGVTVSTVESEREGDTVASLRIGPVEIAVGDSYDIADDEEDSDRVYGRSNAKDSDRDRDGDNNNGGRKKKGEWTVDESTEKFLSTMDKTANSMKKNADMLKEAVSDDFPSRIMKGGERVVGNFEKTFERMGKLASDLYSMWSGDDEK